MSIINEALAAEPILSGVTVSGDVTVQIISWVGIAFVQTVVFSIVGTWWVRNLIDSIRTEIRTERKEIDLSIGAVENEFRDRMADLSRELHIRIDTVVRELTQKVESTYNIQERETAKTRDDLHQLAYHVRDNYARRESIKSFSDEIKGMMADGLRRIEQSHRSE